MAEKQVEELDAEAGPGGDAESGQQGARQDGPILALDVQPVAGGFCFRDGIGQPGIEKGRAEAREGQHQQGRVFIEDQVETAEVEVADTLQDGGEHSAADAGGGPGGEEQAQRLAGMFRRSQA